MKKNRREFLATTARIGMAGGLIAGYGAFGAVAGSYLYPAAGRPVSRLFVAVAAEIAIGSSIAFRAPSGERIAVARLGSGDTGADFIALSSTCPHLGCQVHWQATENRFFCPCHNGAFDATGVATAGPPAQAGQRLARYRLTIEDGLLYIEVPG